MAQAEAAQVAETFSTRGKYVAGGTAVWNQALGVVHPKLLVTGYTGGVTPDVAVDVGDGSDGAFVETRYGEFSQNGDLSGNIIRFDTTGGRELKVTEFVLEDGWFLIPVGGEELVIRSLSDVKIRGQIWCHGQNGAANSGVTGGAGGPGRCGGSAGGAGGGAPGTVGGNGGDSASPVTGGMGGFGNAGGAGGDGGGGGGWSLVTAPDAGTGFTGGVMPGRPGDSTSDPEFDTVDGAGGAGGGGGGGGSTEGGGGGGGGGGIVIIHAAQNFELGSSTDPNIGFIYANGGDGADSTGNGGDGAGGAGGSVQVFAGGQIRLYNTSGASGQAIRGFNVGAASGSGGRNWFTSVTYTGSGFYSPAEEGPVIPGDFVRYYQTPQTVETESYDLLNTLADVNSITPSPASSEFVVQWKGSSDDFVSDDTGWSTDLSVLSRKRYVKFRVTVTALSATAPTLLDSVTINFTPGLREDFDFKSAAGCAMVSSHPFGGAGRGNSMWNLIFLLLPIVFLFFARAMYPRK
jgi:hypothetical protein